MLHRLFHRLTRGNVFTLPNILTTMRLLLIPLFIHCFFAHPDTGAALCILAASALSDILDGAIARHFHMESDFGRFLDPLADKLTQAALLLCLSLRYHNVGFLLGLLLIKELAMLGFALLTLQRTDAVHSARWHGKLNSAVLELSMAAMLLPSFPKEFTGSLVVLCTVSMLFSLFLYTMFFSELLREPI